MPSSPSPTSMKVVSQLDWVSPMISVGMTFAGYIPIYVQDGWQYDAARVIGNDPIDYDLMMNSWVFMVHRKYYWKVRNYLRKAGIGCQ